VARRVRITGERGRWIAFADGRWLAVIHSTWRRGLTGYLDPMTGAKTDGKRYEEYLEALQRESEVIVQKDKPGTLDRAGYVGIFTFRDLFVGDDGSVGLTLIARVADPQNREAR
jgi:hypothetical protein